MCHARDDAREVVIHPFNSVQTSQFTIPPSEPVAGLVWVEAKDHDGSIGSESRPAQ